MIHQEKDGSFTINCKQGEATMSIRSFGMVGKTYKSTQEAFRDADWYVAIERPAKNEYSLFWSLLATLFFVTTFGYIFWQAISRF